MNTFEELYEKAPVAYHELDCKGVILRVNEAEREMLGYGEEEMIGHPVWEFIAAEEVDEGRVALREKLAGKRGSGPRRRTYVTKQGQNLVVELRDRLIRNGGGEVVGIRTTLVDITERTHQEALAKESLRWQGTILETLPFGIVAVDGLGLVAHMNRAAEQLTVTTLQEAQGEQYEQVVELRELHVDGSNSTTLTAMFHRSLVESWRGRGVLGRGGSPVEAEVVSKPLGHEASRVEGFVLILSPEE